MDNQPIIINGHIIMTVPRLIETLVPERRRGLSGTRNDRLIPFVIVDNGILRTLNLNLKDTGLLYPYTVIEIRELMQGSSILPYGPIVTITRDDV